MRADGLIQAGLIYEGLARDAEALDFYRSAARHDPASVEAQINLGRLLARADPAAALAHWDEQRALVDRDPRAGVYRASALVKAGEFEAALANLAEVRARMPETQQNAALLLEIRYLRAFALARMGRGREARAELQELLEADPDHGRARKLLQRLGG